MRMGFWGMCALEPWCGETSGLSYTCLSRCCSSSAAAPRMRVFGRVGLEFSWASQQVLGALRDQAYSQVSQLCSSTRLSFWGPFSEFWTGSDTLGPTPSSELRAHVHSLHARILLLLRCRAQRRAGPWGHSTVPQLYGGDCLTDPVQMANGSSRRALPHLLPQLLPSHPALLLSKNGRIFREPCPVIGHQVCILSLEQSHTPWLTPATPRNRANPIMRFCKGGVQVPSLSWRFQTVLN